ncbi:hypothetical protein HT136_06650 [Novosphingobium profundi]|uniref:hypothetical protein n=1 Tax=Novosphingobium profundi TaxID=1774954 RepID=UPI001BDA281A|nr:hypothetical protein [Novosphingobium profundi]MBT0668045.1 hypothetical protein [Novosphingobium profundi]
MFGISPLGWVHTLGSLPAIPLAAYMFARHGRITPRSGAGRAYLAFMLIGAGSVFLIAHQPVSYAIGAATIGLLVTGFCVEQFLGTTRIKALIETICLSLTVFLLMLPTATEILRRVPDGHPLVTDLHSPLLVGTQVCLLAILVVGLSLQIVHLYRHDMQSSTTRR